MPRINFDLQQLQGFVAVAERGSFRAGAEQIHLSAPALSRRIDKLETILSARLFNRTTRHVELTPLGRSFLERARAALEDLESAMLGISDLAANRSGHVTVACVPSAAIHFLPSVVQTFALRFPLIRIRVIDEAAGQVLASIVSAMPRSHALAKRKSIAWSDLIQERLIAVSRSSGNRQLLDDALAKAGVNPAYRLEVNHIATLLGMVDANLGLAAVPQLALPVTHPSLVGVPLRGPVVSRVLGLGTRQGTKLKAPAQIFHDHLKLALEARD
jgi:DNA-binding transcriptional LysR family regulator